LRAIRKGEHVLCYRDRGIPYDRNRVTQRKLSYLRTPAQPTHNLEKGRQAARRPLSRELSIARRREVVIE
jgi:hypothetical protein